MPDLIIRAPAPQEEEQTISSGPFWPDIVPKTIRDEYRIDNTITPARLKSALYEAIAETNAALATFRIENQDSGLEKLSDIASEKINSESIKVQKYRRAVGCFAKAILLERSRDIDTTGKEDRAADALDPQIEDHRRDWHAAVADIIGRPRTTVELI